MIGKAVRPPEVPTPQIGMSEDELSAIQEKPVSQATLNAIAETQKAIDGAKAATKSDAIESEEKIAQIKSSIPAMGEKPAPVVVPETPALEGDVQEPKYTKGGFLGWFKGIFGKKAAGVALAGTILVGGASQAEAGNEGMKVMIKSSKESDAARLARAAELGKKFTTPENAPSETAAPAPKEAKPAHADPAMEALIARNARDAATRKALGLEGQPKAAATEAKGHKGTDQPLNYRVEALKKEHAARLKAELKTSKAKVSKGLSLDDLDTVVVNKRANHTSVRPEKNSSGTARNKGKKEQKKAEKNKNEKVKIETPLQYEIADKELEKMFNKFHKGFEAAVTKLDFEPNSKVQIFDSKDGAVGIIITSADPKRVRKVESVGEDANTEHALVAALKNLTDENAEVRFFDSKDAFDLKYNASIPVLIENEESHVTIMGNILIKKEGNDTKMKADVQMFDFSPREITGRYIEPTKADYYTDKEVNAKYNDSLRAMYLHGSVLSRAADSSEAYEWLASIFENSVKKFTKVYGKVRAAFPGMAALERSKAGALASVEK